MQKIFYKADSGKLCDRYPSSLPAEKGDPSIDVSDEDYEKTLSCDFGKEWAVSGGRLILRDNGEPLPDVIRSMETVSALEEWFTLYDQQVSQYERALRMGLSPSIHIKDKAYSSLSQLDIDALSKAEELKAERAKMEGGM